jgi:hypothetical protein
MNFDRFVQEYSYAQLGLLKMISLNPASFQNSGIFRRILSYIKNYILIDFELIENKNFEENNCKETIFLCVNNENEAVNLTGLLGGIGEINIKSCGRYNPITKRGNIIPRFWLFVSLLISPILLMYYIFKYKKIKHLKYSADRILIGFAYYIYYKNILKLYNFSNVKIVISNHNNPVSDALLQAASGYPGVVTYYIEHCPLIENWPPIEVDYLVIATNLSLERIGEKWSNDKLLFISNTKYAETSKVLNNIIGIGLAISPNDDILCVQAALQFLRSNFIDPIVVRCHPELGNSYDKILTSLDLNITIMNPKNFSVVDFLSTIRILAVSDSGIFFDAWSAGVLPVKVRFGKICSENTVKDYLLKGLHAFDIELIKTINEYIDEDKSEEIRKEFKNYMSIEQSKLKEFNFKMLTK